MLTGSFGLCTFPAAFTPCICNIKLMCIDINAIATSYIVYNNYNNILFTKILINSTNSKYRPGLVLFKPIRSQYSELSSYMSTTCTLLAFSWRGTNKCQLDKQTVNKHTYIYTQNETSWVTPVRLFQRKTDRICAPVHRCPNDSVAHL